MTSRAGEDPWPGLAEIFTTSTPRPHSWRTASRHASAPSTCFESPVLPSCMNQYRLLA
jgi:hypothetical protein